MGIKRLKPTSPARRYQTYLTRDELTPGAVPEKSLLEPKKRISGRNNDGRITVRRRGGGHKRFYRVIDFKRDKSGIPGRVSQIEYDPNRSAHIALITYLDGEKRYIIAPLGLKVGTTIVAARMRIFFRETHCRSRTFRSVLRFTTSSFAPEKADRWSARPVDLHRSLRKKAITHSLECRPAKSARFQLFAWQLSDRSATPSTKMSASVKQAAAAGWANARKFAALR